MKGIIVFTILGCVFAALPLGAQTAAPEGMVLIPAGKFWMGRADRMQQDALDVVPRARMDDSPANNVYVEAFYLDKYEVTNAEYARFLQLAGTRPPWHWVQGKIPDGQERLPANNVNWFEAAAYCKWAGKRLPTEAEWEKAARGGFDRKHFPWVGEQPSGFGAPLPAAVGRLNAAPVGSFPPNGYGLYDMMGNVMEWTNDWYEQNYYAFMPKENPQGPETGLYKSVRGGGWADGGGEVLSNWYRGFTDPEIRGLTIGMRCAKDAK
jgi:formylglycine-generating enzyme required for sulfatase activity